MACGKDTFKVEGIVIEALPNKTYRAELGNGHRVRAFVVGRAKQIFGGLAPGDRIELEMSPYDLSEGRIVVEAKKTQL